MAGSEKNIGEIYAERAIQDLNSPKPGMRETPSFAEDAAREADGPVIYGGTMPSPSSPDDFARLAEGARNGKIRRRKVSPFNLMLMLIGSAIAIVLYISNVIAVQQLVQEVGALRTRYQQILNEQEVLKAQINRMSSLERIRKMAEDDLGLRNPKDTPRWIQIDGEKVREIEEQMAKDRPTPRKKQE
jgi:cell division protein FtsL